MCDRSKVHVHEGRFARGTTSRKCDCPFDVVALIEDNVWVLRVREAGHNHEPTLPGAHPTHRKAAMTQDVQQEISHQAHVGAPPKQTLSMLRLNHDKENPSFKARDVYNVRQKIRKENLERLLPVLALLKELTMGDEWLTVFHPSTGRLQRLFFAKKSFGKILRINWEVLLMDCTYKTNRYRMPLCIISGVTGLNTSFYIGFAFLSSETSADYIWVLECLAQLYQTLEIPSPTLVITDMEMALINAIQRVCPAANHALCLWHVDKNVLANCKSSFITEEEWQKFYEDWHKVLFAVTEAIFEEKWEYLQRTYDQVHWLPLMYLEDDLLAH